MEANSKHFLRVGIGVTRAKSPETNNNGQQRLIYDHTHTYTLEMSMN